MSILLWTHQSIIQQCGLMETANSEYPFHVDSKMKSFSHKIPKKRVVAEDRFRLFSTCMLHVCCISLEQIAPVLGCLEMLTWFAECWTAVFVYDVSMTSCKATFDDEWRWRIVFSALPPPCSHSRVEIRLLSNASKIDYTSTASRLVDFLGKL